MPKFLQNIQQEAADVAIVIEYPESPWVGEEEAALKSNGVPYVTVRPDEVVGGSLPGKVTKLLDGAKPSYGIKKLPNPFFGERPSNPIHPNPQKSHKAMIGKYRNRPDMEDLFRRRTEARRADGISDLYGGGSDALGELDRAAFADLKAFCKTEREREELSRIEREHGATGAIDYIEKLYNDDE